MTLLAASLASNTPVPHAASPAQPALARAIAAAPGAHTTSFYAHWVTADAAQTARVAKKRGCREARRHDRGVIVLAFGRQRDGGTQSFSNTTRPYAVLQAAAVGFADGLVDCGRGPYLLALSTSNYRTDGDGAVNGALWASFVSSAAAAVATRTSAVVLAGANDIEPSWGPSAYALAWVGSFAASGQPYVFIGSADGCPWRDGQVGCNNGWSEDDVARVAWPSNLSYPLPQVYDDKGRMASQWARLAARSGRQLLGALVQNDACKGSRDRLCPQLDITAATALQQLREAGAQIADVSSDISWR